MKELEGKKLLCIESSKGITKNKEYEIITCYDTYFKITEDNNREGCWDFRWIKGYDDEDEISLFELIDEPKFKQGDMVLVSNDDDNYRVREYIGITSDGKFLCWYEDKKNALPFKYIKPYKEEIKPGDWVKNNYGLIFQHKFGEHTNECTKITSPQLIELLNKEL